MFSREDVSNFINQNFEASWEMVRPVPIVRIDFGNGRVATRTAHGNVASYICNADGKVADILPGIYQPAAYTTALEQPRALVGELARLEAAPRLNRWREYHQARVAAIRAAQQAALLAQARPRIDVGKGRIERPVERFAQIQQEFVAAQVAAAPRPRTAAELASWQPLAADTQLNETQRRLQIHVRLRTSELIRPEQIKTWLYRDVLHADLDDPNLGLGDDFFADFER